MKRMLLGAGLAALSAVGVLDLGASRASAQVPGTSTVYQTVIPGPPTVTYGEQYRVRYRPRRTVIRERPIRVVTPSAGPVIRETSVYRPAPVIQQQVIQPPPVIQQQVIQPDPVIQTRYLQPY